jgi:hypothetical protein
MATTTTTTMPTLSDEQLVELLPLIQESDSVELKLTVPEVSTDRRPGARPRTRCRPDPTGGVLRHSEARAREEGRGRASAADPGQGRRLGREAAPGVPAELPEELRVSPDFRVEVDALPAASSARGAEAGASRDAFTRTLTGERADAANCSRRSSGPSTRARSEGIGLDDLTVLGRSS